MKVAWAFWLLSVFLIGAARSAYAQSRSDPRRARVPFPNCDGRSDDAPALRALLKAAARNCVVQADQSVFNQACVDLPAGRTCKIDSPLVVNGSCVGIRSNGAVLDFRALKSGAAITVKSGHPFSPYGDNVVCWDGLHLAGPGMSTSTVGLLIETGQAVFERLNIHGFGVGVEFGDYAFVDHLDSAFIWNVGTGILCPGKLQDAGENITVNAGGIANSRVGIENQGCGLTVTGTSFDGLSGSAVIDATGGAANIRCVNCYIEYFTAISAPIFDIAACNAWEYIDFRGGAIVNSRVTGPNMRALVRNDPKTLCGGTGSWARFDDVFFANLNPSGKCDAGSGPSCVIGRNAGQVRITASTNGEGGGIGGGLHLP